MPERLLHELVGGGGEDVEARRRGGRPVQDQHVVAAVPGHVAGSQLRTSAREGAATGSPPGGEHELRPVRDKAVECRTRVAAVVERDQVVAAVAVDVAHGEASSRPGERAGLGGPGRLLDRLAAVAEEHREAGTRLAQVVKHDAVADAVAVHVTDDELGLADVEGACLAAPQLLRCEGAAVCDHAHQGSRAVAQIAQNHGVVAPGGVGDDACVGATSRRRRQPRECEHGQEKRQSERRQHPPRLRVECERAHRSPLAMEMAPDDSTSSGRPRQRSGAQRPLRSRRL